MKDTKFYEGMAQRAKKYDIAIGEDLQLTTNRYANRRVIRDISNEITDRFFPKSKARNMKCRILVDTHVVDRLTDREFPVDEFIQILAKLGNGSEKDILHLVDRKVNGEEVPFRINCHGYGSLMIGVTIHTYVGTNPATGEAYDQDTYHIIVRTCYSERGMGCRERTVDVHRIWTRGTPKWFRDLQAQTKKEKEEVHEHLSNLKRNQESARFEG